MNTEILLPVPELKLALSGLNKLVSKRSTLPVLSHVRITRKPNGLVQLQGTDITTFATFTFEHTQEGEVVDTLIPLEHLNKALKCSAKDPVALILDDKTTKIRYSLAGNPVHQQINTLAVSEWPSQPLILAKAHPLSPTFGEALKQALECCSDDASRHVLRGACLDARDAKAHYVVGTNGRFLFSANSFSFPMKEAVIIPSSKFISSSGLLDSDACSLAVEPGKKPDDAKNICLQNRQWQFVTREIEGQYPNWKVVVPKIDSKWTRIKLQEPAVQQLLKVIPNLPGNDHPNYTIRLRNDKNCLWVEGRNKDDQDWTSVAVKDVTITGQDNETNLDRNYFLPALKFGLTELAIENSLTAMVCSGQGKKLVIMPVRPVQQSEPTTDQPAPQTASPTESAATPAPQTDPQPQPSTEPAPTPAQERKTEMTKSTSATTTTPTKAPETSLLDQIESVKESAKNLVRDLTGLTEAVKQVDKDRRANEKELENVRSVVKKLQQVTI